MNSFLPFAPAALGIAGAMLAMAFDAWDHRRTAVVSAVVLLAAGAVTAWWLPAIAGSVRAGGFFSVAPAACLALGAIILAGCGRTLSADRTGSRITALGAMATSASALAAASADVGVLFLAIEALALCGYGMVALGNTDRAREAAMKWFIQGSVATVVFVLGMAVLIGRSGGSLDLDVLAQVAGAGFDAPMATGFVLVLAAMAFKLGAFPFHSWMPDAYETAPPAAAAVLASVGKLGPIAAIMWFSLAVASTAGENVLRIVAVIALASIVFGNLAALRQRSLARMLAYSGIAQVGYALVGLPLVRVELGSRWSNVLLFAVFYALTAGASFILVAALKQSDPEWDGSIAGLAGLSARRPLLALSLAVIMFSLTGIPLTAGFWGKFLVFAGASVGGFLWLAIAGMLGSVVSFGYYGSVIRSAYIDPATPVDDGTHKTPISDNRAVSSAGLAGGMTIALAALILVLGVAPLLTGLAPLMSTFIR